MESILRDFLGKNATGGAHGSHDVYWVPIAIFNQLPIVLWKYNRPPDPERVAEIHQYVSESKRADGMIYIACVNQQLVCYESNHRREALKGLTEVAHVLVDVLWSATDEMVKQEFFRLNKAVSVPDLYVDNSTEESVSLVLSAVDSFCAKYSKLRSPSGRPNRPNYNRDVFTQEFIRVMKELRIPASELLIRLDRLNSEMSTRPRSKLSVNVGQKCDAVGLWLFAWSPVLNASELV
jgi:hypothetical protein